MCSISRTPRRFEYTICTAVAPEEVFTVRLCGATSTPYERLELAGYRLVEAAHMPAEDRRGVGKNDLLDATRIARAVLVPREHVTPSHRA